MVESRYESRNANGPLRANGKRAVPLSMSDGGLTVKKSAYFKYAQVDIICQAGWHRRILVLSRQTRFAGRTFLFAPNIARKETYYVTEDPLQNLS